MATTRMAFTLPAGGDAAAAVDGAWAAYQEASPDLEGRDLDYEANWRYTLGLQPEDVRARASRILAIVRRDGASCREIAEEHRRASAEAWASGDDAAAFEMEEAAEAYAAAATVGGLWEAASEDSLLPPGFLAFAAGPLGGVAWRE